MTINSGPGDATRLACTTQYRRQHAEFLANLELIAARDPHAVQPPQMWMLAMDPVVILEKALNAELYDPTPPSA